MKKKILVTLCVVLLVAVAASIAVFSIFSAKYISRSEAVEIALEHAELAPSQLRELDAEFERSPYGAWYEVDFETFGLEYEYSVDAVTGEILHSVSKPDR